MSKMAALWAKLSSKSVRVVSVVFVAVAPLFAVTAFAELKAVVKTAASASAAPSTCEDSLKVCRANLASCQGASDDLQKDIEANCGGRKLIVTATGLRLGPAPSTSASALPVKVKPVPSTTAPVKSSASTPPVASTVPSTAPSIAPTTPPPPPKKWYGKGYSVMPSEANSPHDFFCTDLRYAPVIGAKGHTVWCVFADKADAITQIGDWISELENDPELAKPENAAKRAEKVAKVRNELFRVDLATEGLGDDELKGLLKSLRDRLGLVQQQVWGVLKTLCLIDDPADPKWTFDAVAEQCSKAIAEQVDRGIVRRGARAELAGSFAVNGGALGFQPSLELTPKLFFGLSDSTKFVIGTSFGATLASPSTPGEVYIWPKLGLGFYTGDPLLRSTSRIDVLVGAKQYFVTSGANPTLNGVRYLGATPFWGTAATAEFAWNLPLSSWLNFTLGGWVGYGVHLNTVSTDPAMLKAGKLEVGNGALFGGNAGLSFRF